MTSWSCPFHAFQLPLHVPDIFSVCPLHFPCMSRSFIASHFPTSPVPFHFPLLSCHVDFLFPSLISLHFLAFPLCSQYFPQQTRFFQRFRNQDVQAHRVFPDFRQKEAGTPNQQRAGRGNRAWDPCFATPAPRRLRLVERHQIAARSVGGVGGGARIRRWAGGGGYPLSSLRCPTRRALSRT